MSVSASELCLGHRPGQLALGCPGQAVTQGVRDGPPPGAKSSAKAYKSGADVLMQLSGAWVTSGNPGPFPGVSVLTSYGRRPVHLARFPQTSFFGPYVMVSAICVNQVRAWRVAGQVRHTSVQVPQSHMAPHREGVTHTRPKATLYCYICTSTRDPEFLNPTQLGEGWTR